MIRSTAIVKLVLVGTATSLLGYEAIRPHADQFNAEDDSGDFAGGPTSATSRPSGSGYTGSYGHSGYGWYHSSSGRSWGGWSSSSHGGTSRGGFGGSGHAAGS